MVKRTSVLNVKFIAAGEVLTGNNNEQEEEGNQEDSTEYITRNWSITEGTEEEMIQEIRAGRMVTVSDGSFFPETKRAAFQMRMESTNGRVKAQLQQHVIGHNEEMDAYRAEATGIWASMAIIRKLTEKHQVRNTTIRFGCDGKSALEKTFNKDCLLYTSPSPRDKRQSRMPSSA